MHLFGYLYEDLQSMFLTKSYEVSHPYKATGPYPGKWDPINNPQYTPLRFIRSINLRQRLASYFTSLVFLSKILLESLSRFFQSRYRSFTSCPAGPN